MAFIIPYIGKALRLRPQDLARQALGFAHRKFLNSVRRFRDRCQITYCQNSPQGKLSQYFSKLHPSIPDKDRECLRALAEHYLDHRFDLLGSGWGQVNHGTHCRGLEGHRYQMGVPVKADRKGQWLEGRINPANRAESQRIWRLVDESHTPIDWHLDFKSGYRWSEDTWYLDIPCGHKLGADIKAPWELARMQHLPQLALACALAGEAQLGFAPHHVCAREFRNQVLDFIATNPPRFGVNWRCTMDVGIRVANWLVAYDLFRACGTQFDAEFEAEFCGSVYQHGAHIINNLEWSPQFRANHYLANIVGLLFAAAYLPRTAETDTWLAFAVQELIVEVGFQFHPDGTNFEASTSYHRLSAEMVVWATALVLGWPPAKQAALQEYEHRWHKVSPPLKPAPIQLYPMGGSEDRLTPFPDWYIERLEKMAEFTTHITKPNRHIPQIGDNDSGRFLKLQPVYHQMTVAEAKARYANLEGYTGLPDDAFFWDEVFLDHRHLVAAINGLFGRDDFAEFTAGVSLETELVQHLARGTRFPSYRHAEEPTAAERVCVGTVDDCTPLGVELDSLPAAQRQVIEISTPGGDFLEGVKLYAYADFGLYLYRSQRLYLAVRCGGISQKGQASHAHNDQLSIELNVDGEDWIADPGTYLYTPLPERRNEYRSVRAHFAPAPPDREEGGQLDAGIFLLPNPIEGKCEWWNHGGFVGKLRDADLKIFLKKCSVTLTAYNLTFSRKAPVAISSGYGKLEREKRQCLNIVSTP